MTERKQPTNGTGGLKWSTIGRLSSIPIMIIGFGVTQIVQIALMSQKIDTHITADQKRDDRVESRVHVVELTVAAMGND